MFKQRGLSGGAWFILSIATLAIIGCIYNNSVSLTSITNNISAFKNSSSSVNQTSQPNVQTSKQTAQTTPNSAVQAPHTTASTSTTSSGKIVPSQYEIGLEMSRTVEVSNPTAKAGGLKKPSHTNQPQF